MITPAQAIEAEQIFKWAHDLEHSEAFRELVVREIREREAEHDRCGTDVSRKPRERAEHHRALKLARDLIGHGDAPGIVAKKKAEALEVLRQWKEQKGEAFLPLPDGRNL